MSHPNQRAADELRDHLDALLALEAERDALKERRTERIGLIKARGYDPKALLAVLQRVREDEAARRKRESVAASAEIYAATLGMDLGDFGARSDPGLSPGARDAIERSRRPGQPHPGPPDPGSPDGDDDAPHAAGQTRQPETMAGTPLAPSADEISAARQQGADAFHAGVDVLANPYLAGDPRRFVWDNGWCAAGGTDGMDIPAHLRRPADRRRPKPEPEAPAPAAESDITTKAGPPSTSDEPTPDEDDA